jgi:transcriptional regulator with XRE-family HTH domain
MDRHRSPTLLRRQLASRLRRLREDTGMTSEQVSEHLCCTLSKISRIETASVRVNPRDLRDLLVLYGVTGQLREDLLRLAEEARRKESWWRAFSDVPDVRRYMAHERSAVSICSYESLVIPGLFQVEEYARLIIAVLFPDLPPQRVERLVELRMARQSILHGSNAVDLEVVLDEGALHRLLSEREIMRKQLRHLIEVASLPNVTLQLLPFGAGPHPGMAGPFTILGFADAADSDLVYIESSTGDVYIDQDDQLALYRTRFERLQAAALPPADSTAFLIELTKQNDAR